MTAHPADFAPAHPPIELTAETLDEAAKGLPRPVRAGLAFLTGLRRGAVTVGLPDGRWVRAHGDGDGPEGTIVLKDYSAATKFVKSGDIGFAEAYFDGAWDSPDLTAFLQVFFANHDMLHEVSERMPLVTLAQRLRHWLRRNTRRGARRNIHAHYDLGNEFFASWLDETMTYSSALFETGQEPLAGAQKAKYAALARRIGLEPGHDVLEIGCGWGGFAVYAAGEIGARVTGLTISQAQYEHARRRVFEAGLAEKVTLKLQDYRDETDVYDRIASIEMIEAVGEAYWPAYFQRLHACLKPGGTAGVQAITIDDAQFATYRLQPDFVQTYIFPGGMLPARKALRTEAEKAGLSMGEDTGFALSYARTLVAWRERFLAAWPDIASMGFDERFKRLWLYYLSYCEAGFLAGNIDVRQIAFTRD